MLTGINGYILNSTLDIDRWAVTFDTLSRLAPHAPYGLWELWFYGLHIR